MKALIVIDFTKDFVTGSLPVGQPAVEIDETIAAVTEAYCKNKHEVIMAVDLHEENDPYHPETALFPPHNIRNTEGRQLYGRLAQVMEERKEIYSGWIRRDIVHSVGPIWNSDCVHVVLRILH